MKPASDLRRKLIALGTPSEFTRGAFLVAQGGDRHAPVAILNLIDTIMLPRQIRLNAGEAWLELNVAGRRLVSVAGASGDLDLPAESLGQPLSRDMPEALDELLAVIARLAGREGPITLSQMPGDPGLDVTEKGVSAAFLAEQWSLDLDARPAGPIETFHGTCRTHATTSVLILAGAPPISEGIKAQGDAMIDWDNAARLELIDKIGETEKGLSDRILLALPGLLPDGALMIYAALGQERSLHATQEDDLVHFLSAWANVIA